MTQTQEAQTRVDVDAPVQTKRYLPRNLLFIAALAAILCVWFLLFRAALMIRNAPLISGMPASELARPFYVGFRFDLATACYLLLPLSLGIFFPFASIDRNARTRRFVYWSFLAVMGVISYLLLAEFEFFREFQVRYNQIAITYLDQPTTVGGMIWNGYPVVRYTLAWLAAMVLLGLAVRWLMRRIYTPSQAAAMPLSRSYILSESGCIGLVVLALVFGLRGGFQSTPLRWGDAFKSDFDIINQLSLNGIYTLGKTVIDNYARTNAGDQFADRMDAAEARRIARELIVPANDRLLAPDDSTVLRIPAPSQARIVNLKSGVTRTNVVVVLMESFSGQLVGACGAREDFTPSMSSIAREGILFDRAFSIGTHTHQGIFGSLLSFPNLPGYEAMMQSPLANQPFASLPSVLQAEGYQTMFLYNGSFDWDNMRGFFRKQGMDRFIGGSDFDSSVRRDSVWGVDDIEVFRRANVEFEAAAKSGPFMGVILTLSNHAPWDLPKYELPPVTGHGELDAPLSGMRYADWCVGQFIAQARKLDYFKNTLFVFVGDHGSRAVSQKLTSAGVLTHHVPLVFFGPGVLDVPPRVDHRVSSQLNIVPTITGLLNVQRPVATWGRDLFASAEATVAIFKGSTGDNAIAIVEDDHLLAIDEAGKAVLYRYTLLPDAAATPVSNPELQQRLNQQLLAVLQCGIQDLKAMKAGPQASTVSR